MKHTLRIQPAYFLAGIFLSLILVAFGVALWPFFHQQKPKTTIATVPAKQVQVQASPSAEVVDSTPSATPSSPPPSIAGPGIPILMYHYVGNNPNPKDLQRDVLEITPDKFDEEMRYLSTSGYTPITLDTLYAIFNKTAAMPPKPIVLTLDDGYIDFYLNAFPILQKYGFHAVAFIPTGLMDQGYYLHWDQIIQMYHSGLISFQAHSVHHPNLPSLPYASILSELKDSKTTLESKLGSPVNFIAYPFGATNGLVFKAAREAGYVGGVGTWYGRATGPSLDMPRIRINGSISIADFANKIRE